MLLGSFLLQAKVTANNDKNRTFSVWYVPEVTGTHKVSPQPMGRLVAGTVAAWPQAPLSQSPAPGHRSLCSLLASILPRAPLRCMWTSPRVTPVK